MPPSTSQHTQWASTAVYRRVLPEHELSALRDEAESLAFCPNFWLEKDALQASKSPRSPVEDAITSLYTRIMAPRLPDECLGAEWWVQTYDCGKGLSFHFDKDEILFRRRQEMRHPLLSSVLYLTGSPEADRQAPTVIIDQHFDASIRRATPERPERCTLIWPHRNSFVVFDGGLGHGVLDSACQQRRITLLVNWWAEKPEAVSVAPPLATLSRPPGEALVETPLTSQLVVLELKDSEDTGVVTVDDLLAAFGLRCTGEEALDAVSIEHRGYQLYPVDNSQPEQLQTLVTAAAFVPHALLEAESESSEEA